MSSINTNKLYQSYIHGINHNIRVSIFALIISIYENININDFKLIIEAAKYHDIGRRNDLEDREHGLLSSKKLDFLNNIYSDDELIYLKTIISCHSLNDNMFLDIAEENNISDIERCRRMYNILKDSDALDRVRLEYPYIKIDLLRTNTAKRLILFAYELYENYKENLEVKKINKELIITNAKEKFNGELLDIVLNQINDYFELTESDYIIENKYNIGDEVILNNDHLLHGIGKHTDLLDIFADRGIVSPDFFNTNINHAFCYTSAFWSVDKDISLKEFIKNYSGIVANYNDIYEQVPYGKLDEFVEKMKNVDHWLWTAESSMEIRFMPSLARNINQIGFIINTENEIAQRIRSNSVFKDNFNKKYAFEFLNENHKEKFIKDGFTADFFERTDYLIFGIPKNCIEGILVGRLYEKDKDMLNKIKYYFPNCYICNLDGKIIF